MRLETYTNRTALMQGLAGIMADELRQALKHGPATLSVPGGTTPGPVFDALARTDLDWARVAVILNDERWVPEDNPRSNTRLLRERLLTGHAARAHLVPLYARYPNPEDALAALAQGIIPHLPLTVLLLGMGQDMHTASLFPGADLLAEALAPDAPPLLAMRAAAAGEPRVTLTAPVLRAAGKIHILITGDDKRAAVERALTLPEAEAPIACVLPLATLHWAE